MKIFNSLKNFWNKLFSKKVVKDLTHSSPVPAATIVEVLKCAKERYINKNLNIGMCFCIYTSMRAILNKSFANDHEYLIINDYKYLNRYIPEFNPKFLNGNSKSVYWWPLNDVESRIKAFDKLISIYESKNSQ